MLLLLNLVRATSLTVSNISLEKAADSKILNKDGVIAFDQDFVFSYFNKTMFYFQKFDTTLYNLGNISYSLE
jgi:hypothetical protein